MRKLLRLLLVFGLGAVFGPIIYAAIAAALPSNPTPVVTPKEAEVGRLVAVYRAELEPNRLFLTVKPPPNGKECGYDPDQLFPDAFDSMAMASRRGLFSDYEGYYALHKWRNDQLGEGFVQAIQAKMVEEMSLFEAGFLRRCIQSTVISSWCLDRVAAFADRVDRNGPESRNRAPGGGYEDRIVCRYSDGVAVRKGLPLAPDLDHRPANHVRSEN